MSEIMTLEEMEARFPSEWVIIVDYETDEYEKPISGRVLIHSKDRDEFDRKLLELRPTDFASRYLGEWPTDLELAINL